ncbi:MAG: hypothetical protein Kow00124_29460 [Anaerolineae bacterium]
MVHLDQDLAFVEAMSAELKSYLLADELYWPLRGPGGVLPQGTLGGLLLRLHRLATLGDQLTPEERMRVTELAGQVQDELSTWGVQVDARLKREARARLRGWTQYLDELEQNPDRYAPDYRAQVEGRTVLALLLERLEGLPDLAQELAALDSRLRGLTEPGPFVWDEAQQAAFPPGRFWWLYVQPVI